MADTISYPLANFGFQPRLNIRKLNSEGVG